MKVIPSDEKTGVISRITELLDPGSFMEMGERVSARYTEFYHPDSVVESDGVVTGYGTVNGSLVFVYLVGHRAYGLRHCHELNPRHLSVSLQLMRQTCYAELVAIEGLVGKLRYGRVHASLVAQQV